jgi:hypothetical protein
MIQKENCGCTSCGEEIPVPIDLSAGAKQEFVEECPVCRHPNIIHVDVEQDGNIRVWVTEE